jgi:hypothetical protein
MVQMHSGAPNRPASMRVCVRTTFSGQSCRRFQSFGFQNEQPILIASLEDDLMVVVALAFDSLNSARKQKDLKVLFVDESGTHRGAQKRVQAMQLTLCFSGALEISPKRCTAQRRKRRLQVAHAAKRLTLRKLRSTISGPSGRHVERGKCLFSSCAPK